MSWHALTRKWMTASSLVLERSCLRRIVSNELAQTKRSIREDVAVCISMTFPPEPHTHNPQRSFRPSGMTPAFAMGIIRGQTPHFCSSQAIVFPSCARQLDVGKQSGKSDSLIAAARKNGRTAFAAPRFSLPTPKCFSGHASSGVRVKKHSIPQQPKL